MAAGDFTAFQLGDIILLEEDIMGMGRTSELKTSIVSGQAILQHQDHMILPYYENNGVGQRCVSIKVATNRTCDIGIDSTPTVSCAVDTGAESEAEAITLDKENLVKYNFRVLDNQCNSAMSFERLMADHMIKGKAKMEVQLSKLAIAELSSNADTPSASWFNTTGTVSSDTFVVDPSDWSSDLIADIRYAMGLTKASDPIIINGNNFYNEQFLAAYKGIACCDNDSVLLNGPFGLYFDIHNVDQTLSGKFTLAVDRNALIFWSAPDTDINALPMGQPLLMMNDTYHYWTTLPRLTYSANGRTDNPIYVDVRQKRVCVGSGVQSNQYGWDVEMVVRGVLNVNLPNCDDYQGILKIQKLASGS